MDALVVHLDPHLEIIRDGFALPVALSTASQLDLLSLPTMHQKPTNGKKIEPKSAGRSQSA